MTPFLGDIILAKGIVLCVRHIAGKPGPLGPRKAAAAAALRAEFPDAHENTIRAAVDFAVAACLCCQCYRPSRPGSRPQEADVPDARRAIRDARRRRRTGE